MQTNSSWDVDSCPIISSSSSAQKEFFHNQIGLHCHAFNCRTYIVHIKMLEGQSNYFQPSRLFFGDVVNCVLRYYESEIPLVLAKCINWSALLRWPLRTYALPCNNGNKEYVEAIFTQILLTFLCLSWFLDSVIVEWLQCSLEGTVVV